MRIVRLLGLLLVTILATAWAYFGALRAAVAPTFLPVVVFGAMCLFGSVVVALHGEVFGK